MKETLQKLLENFHDDNDARYEKVKAWAVTTIKDLRSAGIDIPNVKITDDEIMISDLLSDIDLEISKKSDKKKDNGDARSLVQKIYTKALYVNEDKNLTKICLPETMAAFADFYVNSNYDDHIVSTIRGVTGKEGPQLNEQSLLNFIAKVATINAAYDRLTHKELKQKLLQNFNDDPAFAKADPAFVQSLNSITGFNIARSSYNKAFAKNIQNFFKEAAKYNVTFREEEQQLFEKTCQAFYFNDNFDSNNFYILQDVVEKVPIIAKAKQEALDKQKLDELQGKYPHQGQVGTAAVATLIVSQAAALQQIKAEHQQIIAAQKGIQAEQKKIAIQQNSILAFLKMIWHLIKTFFRPKSKETFVDKINQEGVENQIKRT
jgi:hypothetical protein